MLGKAAKTRALVDMLKGELTSEILFKENETELVSNYRPISILPVFSKLLERIMYNKIYSHVTNNHLLYTKQFGFQKQCSTEYAILQLTKEIINSFEKNQFTLGVFIDLSKAFDTVNHKTTKSTKLTYFGIEGTQLKWFQSYLHNRKQYVPFGNKQTIKLAISKLWSASRFYIGSTSLLALR